MLERVRLQLERARASLFFVPASFVIGAIATAGGMLQLDSYLARSGVVLPSFLATTPDSARSLLSTVASATITVAGTVFAITLVSIQLASSQFSPRVIPGFLRDSRQQRVMGLAVGTFAYCLVVLRSVRGPLDANLGFVPHTASALSLVMAIVTIVALVGFLDRSSRTMQVGQIIQQLTAETVGRIRDLYPHPAAHTPQRALAEYRYPDGRGLVVRSVATGWVLHIDTDALLRSLPPSGIMRLEVRNGSFLAEGQSLGMVWPVPDDAPPLTNAISNAIILGDSRILLKDVAFGIRQLVDIGLRALSPGTNDPTTAYDVIVHLGAVMRELLWRDLPEPVRVADGRRLLTVNDLTHDDYVNRAFDQIRLAGAAQSSIAATLLQTLGALASDLERDGLTERASSIRRQAEPTVASYESVTPLPEDLARLRELADRHGFGSKTSPAPEGAGLPMS